MAGLAPQQESQVWDDDYGSVTITQDNIVFSPPLYRQRYIKVKNAIISLGKGKFTKVVDLGCSEMKFFRYLLGVPWLREVVLLDQDEQVLQDGVQRVSPLAADHLFLREEALHVTVVRGDATTPHPCLAHTHAVTMIELIEHMQLCELPGLVKCVFRYMRPQLVVVTTPNSDFNQYIPGFTPGSFRHWDHKFEWTGKQFHQWCEGIVKEHQEYTVELSGCGRGPDNTYCSQVAIFTRSTSHSWDTPLSTSLEEDCLAMQNLDIDDKSNITSNLDVISNSDIIGSLDISVTGKLDITSTFDKTGNSFPSGKQDSYKIVAEYDYPYDKRTPEERDHDNILGSFFALKRCLQDVEADVDSPMTSLLHPRSPFTGSNTQDTHIQFPITSLGSEDSHIHVVENETEKENCFYIINNRFAILPMRSLLAWMNYGADINLTIDAIRMIVAEECLETAGSGDDWRGKLLLWEEETYSDNSPGNISDDDDDERSCGGGEEEWWSKEGKCDVDGKEWWSYDDKWDDGGKEWRNNEDSDGSNVGREGCSSNNTGWCEVADMLPGHAQENWDVNPNPPLDPNWT